MNDDLKLALNKKLADFCRKNGITSLKTSDFEVHFSPEALFPESDYKRKQATSEVAEQTITQYTDEEILLWSSQGVSHEERAN